MLNPLCLFVDAFLSIALAWNTVVGLLGQGSLAVDDATIDRMFDLLFFSCGIREG